MTIQTFMKRCAFAAAVVAFLFYAATLNRAQFRGTEAIPEIRFKPGERTVIKEGTVSLPHGEGDMYNDGADRYSLHYRAGQRLTLNLESEAKRAIFTITRDGEDSPNLPTSTTKWAGRLPQSGKYYITVWTREGAAKYALKVSLR